MKRCRIFVFLPLLAAVLLASGCAYPISKQYREQARNLSVAQVINDPNSSRGAMVIWGGLIVRIEHQGGSGSVLLVEQYPLDRGGEPRGWGDPGGRFQVRTQRYLDPTLYEKGRWVTVAGEVTGVILERKEKVQYRYPELAAREIYLWPSYPDYTFSPYYFDYHPYWYGWGPPWGMGYYYSPGWYGGWGWGWGW